MYFGALFFRTVSDGVLTVDQVHPRAVLGIHETTTDEAVWSADATELIKLVGKDMIVAFPESYLCFVNHPVEETIIDDPMENIAEPLAKVAKTASTGAGGNPMPSPRGRTPPEATMPMPKRHETKLCNMRDMQLENQFKRAGDFNTPLAGCSSST